MQRIPQHVWMAGGGLVAAVLAVRFLYMPALDRLNSQRTRLEALQMKTADAEALMSQRAAHEEALKRAQSQSLGLEQRVHHSTARILDRLSQQAKSHQLELTVVQEPVLDGAAQALRFGPGLTLQEVPLRLHLYGRFRQVGEFLGGLREAPFLAAVKQVDMVKPAEQTGSLTTEVMIGVYLAEQPS